MDTLYSLEGNLRAHDTSHDEIRRERREKALPIMSAIEV
jgi:hypothetical protein